MRILFVSVFLFVSVHLSAQSNTDLNKLFDKKWKLEYYEINKHHFFPPDLNNENYMQFFANNTTKSFQGGKVTTGKWQYNKSKNSIIIFDQQETVLKIISIKDNNFIFESSKDGEVMIVHMRK